MSTWVVFDKVTFDIHEKTFSKGSADVLHRWYSLKGIDVGVEEVTVETIEQWLTWKALSK